MNGISMMILFGVLSIFLSSAASIFDIVLQNASAQNQEHNDEGKKTYVLLFEQNKIGNIDNSTKIVSAIVGSNLVKIKEELLEEINLSPSPQLKEKS